MFWLELLTLRDISTTFHQFDGVGSNHDGERAGNLILSDLGVGISPDVMLTQNSAGVCPSLLYSSFNHLPLRSALLLEAG